MARNIIQMYRGDTKNISISVVGDLDTERLEEGDDIFLGIMEVGQDFEDAIIRRKLSYGEYSVEISTQQIVNFVLKPEDTLNLYDGVYYYSVKLRTKQGKVMTLIPKTKLVILD